MMFLSMVSEYKQVCMSSRSTKGFHWSGTGGGRSDPCCHPQRAVWNFGVPCGWAWASWGKLQRVQQKDQANHPVDVCSFKGPRLAPAEGGIILYESLQDKWRHRISAESMDKLGQGMEDSSSEEACLKPIWCQWNEMTAFLQAFLKSQQMIWPL